VLRSILPPFVFIFLFLHISYAPLTCRVSSRFPAGRPEEKHVNARRRRSSTSTASRINNERLTPRQSQAPNFYISERAGRAEPDEESRRWSSEPRDANAMGSTRARADKSSLIILFRGRIAFSLIEGTGRGLRTAAFLRKLNCLWKPNYYVPLSYISVT